MQDTPPSGPPGPTLFVTGLPVDCTNDFCKSIFGQYGIVKDARMLPVLPGKAAAAAVVEMNTADDAKWIVEHVNGNVPQSLTTPVTVSFKFRGFKGKGEKGFGKGFGFGGLDLGGGKGAESGPNPAAAALLQVLVPLVAAVAGGGGGGAAEGGKGAW
ncbi:SXL [Symbiodinium microadriaticum]|nr:SXL [Symbiodinium sp. KB8]CAE7881311.1 SXL [Symbiodinium microadriaticum]